jgi:methylmalonyl-CoA mutase N-terminal domain/subunit
MLNPPPGEYPFTRGIHPRMYAERLWTMRQYAGFGTAEETNRRTRELIARGQKGMSVAFDLPTQMGYDPDAPEAEGEVGRTGVSIASRRDLAVLLEGIPLESVSVSMTINATAAILLALAVNEAEARGCARAALDGTVQNDILKEFIARGTYVFPPGPSMRLCLDIAEFCLREMPRWNFISVSGYHMREAGCTAAQEIGLTLANGVCYVTEAVRRGLAVDAVGRRISFFFAAHNNFVEEVAKFRAARRLWARLMKERLGASDPRAMMMRFHAQTAGSTLTARQPQNNLVRVTLQALAAVLGGAQSLHTNALDEALALPTAEAARLALRTQQIIALETDAAGVPDPLGGALRIEQETDRLEAEAALIVRRIDERGGALEAIRARFPQQAIEQSALEQQRRIERGESVVVGVNRYVEAESAASVSTLVLDPALQRRRREEVARLRRERDGGAAGRARDALRRAAEGTANLVPPILECVRADVTLGEICASLQEIFGRYRGEHS